MVDLIYLFNREDTLLEILSKNDFDNFNCKKQLNGSMEMSFITKSKSNIKRFNKVGVFIDDEFQLFYIDDFNDFKSLEENEIETICLADFYNLSNTIIEDKRIINGPINTAITKALEGTDYKVGVVETFENKDINFYFINSLEALNKIISTYNCEFNARYILNEDNTISKFIDLRHRLGIDTGLRFTYDTVLENVEKSPINEGLFNVLYGRGKSLETEDGGFSRKLDFAEVNNGKKYVEDLDSIKKYGRLEGIYENSNIEDKTILLEKTKERLEEVKYQKFNYKATVKDITKILGLEHFKVELGDSIIILDEEINDIVEARIIEIDINSDEVFLTLGHYQKGLIDEDLENKFDNIKDSLDKIENEKIDDSKYPNTLPSVPVLEGKGLFATVDLSWTFENKSYYTYEVYASKQKDFNPSIFNRIFEGKASSLLHEVKPSQTWYYRCRAKNTHGNYTDFSNQVEAHTLKLSDAAEYFEEAAIGHALIKDLDADKITVGTLKGNRIDARNINVTDGNGKKTLAIDSFGNVTLLPTNFKILVEGKEESVISQSSFNVAMNNINLSVGEIKTTVTETKENISEITDNTNKIKTELKNDIKDVENSLSSLDSTMNGAFKDGVVNEAETKAINERLVQLDKEKTDLDVQYNAIITNTDLQGTAKINITNAKNDFNSKYTDMKNYITSAISDKKITEVEKTNINTKTKAYTTSLANLQKCFNEAFDSISKIKADKAQTNANNHTNSEINKVVTITNSKFSEIKATTDSISSKVSKVEEKTVAIDGKVTSHDKRIQNAEQKITPSAIVQSVTENFNNGGKVTTATMELNKNGLTTTSGSYKTSISNGVVTVRDKNSNNKTIELNNDIQIFNPTSGITSDFCGGIRRSISLDDNKKGLELTIDDGEDFLALSHITSGEGGIGDPSTYFIRMNRTGDVHIFRDVNFNNWNTKDIRLNYKRAKETWTNDMYFYANQINTDYSSGNLCLNYWKGASAGTNSTKVYINDGTNTGGRGVLYCKSVDAKSAFMQVQDTELGRKASYAQTALDDFIEDLYFGIVKDDGTCVIVYDHDFISQANLSMNYHIQVTGYEGSNFKIERFSNHLKLSGGQANEEVSVVIKARTKSQEFVRYSNIDEDSELNNWGAEHLLKGRLVEREDKENSLEYLFKTEIDKRIYLKEKAMLAYRDSIKEILSKKLEEIIDD